MMTFKERCCLSLAARPVYQWYGLTLLCLCMSCFVWWHCLYKTWYARWRDVAQEVAVMHQCRAKRAEYAGGVDENGIAASGMSGAKSSAANVCATGSHAAVELASRLGLEVYSVTTLEQESLRLHQSDQATSDREASRGYDPARRSLVRSLGAQVGKQCFVSSDVVLLGTFEQFIAYCNALYQDASVFIRRCEVQQKDDLLRMKFSVVGLFW